MPTDAVLDQACQRFAHPRRLAQHARRKLRLQAYFAWVNGPRVHPCTAVFTGA
jgi:hypothetical protein